MRNMFAGIASTFGALLITGGLFQVNPLLGTGFLLMWLGHSARSDIDREIYKGIAKEMDHRHEELMVNFDDIRKRI